MFPYKTEAIADKRTTNPLQSEEKKGRTFFKSDWTCFKANNSVSPIGHRSSQTRVSINNCLSQKCRNGQESRTKFNFPDYPDRVPQIASDAGGKCFHMSATWCRPIGDRVPDRSQTVADHMETRLYCSPITETLFEGLSILAAE